MASIPADVLDYSIPAYFYPCQSNPTAKTLIIAFTSHGGSGIQFEYINVLKQYDKAHVLFLSSQFHNSWYINGGLSDRYPTKDVIMTDIIDPILTTYGITQVITLGEGSGGTGAVYFGWELAEIVSTSILAFSPYNSTDAANWNLTRDICSANPKPTLKKNFKIFVDKKYQPEVDRMQNLTAYLTVYEVDGAQHLGKSAYKLGNLFKYLDAELDTLDEQDDREYGAITNAIWDVDRLVCHAEDIRDGICDEVLGKA